MVKSRALEAQLIAATAAERAALHFGSGDLEKCLESYMISMEALQEAIKLTREEHVVCSLRAQFAATLAKAEAVRASMDAAAQSSAVPSASGEDGAGPGTPPASGSGPPTSSGPPTPSSAGPPTPSSIDAGGTNSVGGGKQRAARRSSSGRLATPGQGPGGRPGGSPGNLTPPEDKPAVYGLLPLALKFVQRGYQAEAAGRLQEALEMYEKALECYRLDLSAGTGAADGVRPVVLRSFQRTLERAEALARAIQDHNAAAVAAAQQHSKRHAIKELLRVSVPEKFGWLFSQFQQQEAAAAAAAASSHPPPGVAPPSSSPAANPNANVPTVPSPPGGPPGQGMVSGGMTMTAAATGPSAPFNFYPSGAGPRPHGSLAPLDAGGGGPGGPPGPGNAAAFAPSAPSFTADALSSVGGADVDSGASLTGVVSGDPGGAPETGTMGTEASFRRILVEAGEAPGEARVEEGGIARTFQSMEDSWAGFNLSLGSPDEGGAGPSSRHPQGGGEGSESDSDVQQYIKTAEGSAPLPPSHPDDSVAGGVANTSSGEAVNLSAESSLEPLEPLVEPRVCCICMDHVNNAVMVPCGHLCTCVECASLVRACPVCRSGIQQVVRVYVT